MEKRGAYGVYFIFKSMEQGRTFRITVPKYPTQDPNHRILAVQRSRFTHYYFYIRDEVLGPIIVRVASFFPFHTTYWLKAIPSSSANWSVPASDATKTTTPSWRWTTWLHSKPPPTG
jgi:hypothetical protein